MSRSDLANHPAVSFTVKRPLPVSRGTSESSSTSSFKAPAEAKRSGASAVAAPSPLAISSNSNGKRRQTRSHHDDDSSDDDAGTEDEIITGFDSLGVQRAEERLIEGPLVIPALANRDWRAAARRRQSATIFVPNSGRAAVSVGADGSVGGLGTRDTINSGPQLSGIVTSKRDRSSVQPAEADESNAEVTGSNDTVDVEMAVQEAGSAPEQPLTEDQIALQAILAGDQPELAQIDMIPALQSDRGAPQTETDAYREDVLTRPDSSSIEDYERIPVEQFGAALLRGMGWKEGMAASKTRKGPTEPYVPVSRPALLGIGAKERVVDDGGAGAGKNSKPQRPEKRYVPVVKRARDGTIISDDIKTSSALVQSSRSNPSSRRASQSPPRRERERDRDRRGESDRDNEYSSRHRDDRDRRGDRYVDSNRPRDRDHDRRRDDNNNDRDRPRDGREKDKSGERDRYREKDQGRGGHYRSESDRRDKDYDDSRSRDSRDKSRSRY